MRKVQDIVEILQKLEISNPEIDNKVIEIMRSNEHFRQLLGEQEILYSQIGSLQSRNELQKHQLKELLQYNQKVSQENTELQMRLLRLEQEYEQQYSRAEFLEQHKDGVLQDIDRLIFYIENEFKELGLFESGYNQNPVDKVYELIEKLKNDLSKSASEIEELQKNNDQLNQLKEHLQNENNQLFDQNEDYKEQIENISSAITEQQKNNTLIPSLENEISSLQQKLNSSQEQFQISNQKMNIELQAKQQVIDELEKENLKLEKQLELKDMEIKRNFDEYQSCLNQAEESFNAEKFALQQNFHELSIKLKQTSIQYEEITKSSNQKKINQLEMTILQNQNVDMKAQLINEQKLYEQKIQILTQEKNSIIQKQKQKREILEEENLRLNKSQIELSMKVNTLEFEKKQMKEQVKEKTYEVETLKIQYTNQNEYLKKQVQELESILQRTKSSEADLEHRLLIIESEKSDLEMTLKRYKR